jgi:hypothetical protein
MLNLRNNIEADLALLQEMPRLGTGEVRGGGCGEAGSSCFRRLPMLMVFRRPTAEVLMYSLSGRMLLEPVLRMLLRCAPLGPLAANRSQGELVPP